MWRDMHQKEKKIMTSILSKSVEDRIGIFRFWNAYAWYRKTKFQQNTYLFVFEWLVVDQILIKLP